MPSPTRRRVKRRPPISAKAADLGAKLRGYQRRRERTPRPSGLQDRRVGRRSRRCAPRAQSRPREDDVRHSFVATKTTGRRRTTSGSASSGTFSAHGCRRIDDRRYRRIWSASRSVTVPEASRALDRGEVARRVLGAVLSSEGEVPVVDAGEVQHLPQVIGGVRRGDQTPARSQHTCELGKHHGRGRGRGTASTRRRRRRTMRPRTAAPGRPRRARRHRAHG